MTVLDEQVTYSCDKIEMGVRWIEGSHPSLGKVINGRNGCETIQNFTRYKRPVL